MQLTLNVHPHDSAEVVEEDHLRSSERHQPQGAEVMQFLVRPTFQPCKAVVRDISSTGVAFLFHQALDKGSLLAVQLGESSEAVSTIRKAEVVHSRIYTPGEDRERWEKPLTFLQRISRFLGFRQADPLAGEEFWLIGCRFDQPLSEQDLAAVLSRV